MRIFLNRQIMKPKLDDKESGKRKRDHGLND